MTGSRFPCPVCESARTRLQTERLGLYYCDSCGHRFTPDPGEMEPYDEAYFLETHKNWFANPDRTLFESLSGEIPAKAAGRTLRLLDVGCGNGAFLEYVLGKKRDDVELAGIDLIENSHPSIRYTKGDFFTAEIEGRFDVISSLYMIEHVEDPSRFLRRTADLLVPGGLLLLVTLDSDSLIYRIATFLNRFGISVAYDRLYSPHHLNHFTGQSLNRLVAGNGYDVLQQRKHNCPIESMDVPKRGVLLESLFRLAVRAIFAVSDLIGAGIYQTVIARKGS